MSGLLSNPMRAGTARRRLTKKGVLWLTRRIGRHALRGEWQSAHAVAASRDRLLATITDTDTGIDAMRAAADEARGVLAVTMSGQADD
jgi:hypothetical protein